MSRALELARQAALEVKYPLAPWWCWTAGSLARDATGERRAATPCPMQN